MKLLETNSVHGAGLSLSEYIHSKSDVSPSTNIGALTAPEIVMSNSPNSEPAGIAAYIGPPNAFPISVVVFSIHQYL